SFPLLTTRRRRLSTHSSHPVQTGAPASGLKATTFPGSPRMTTERTLNTEDYWEFPSRESDVYTWTSARPFPTTRVLIGLLRQRCTHEMPQSRRLRGYLRHRKSRCGNLAGTRLGAWAHTSSPELRANVLSGD